MIDIQKIAREAGIDLRSPDNYCREVYWAATDDELTRFAALYRARVLEEAAEYFQDGWASPDCYEIAAAVRALKEQQ